MKTEPVPNNSIPAIAVENVSKSYPRQGLFAFLRPTRNAPGVQALRDISFTVQEGETVGLLGPNGAGKTTLLKTIANLLYPTSGRIRIHGHDLLQEPLKGRSQMGLVTCDERSFYWRLTGRQNLLFFATLYHVPLSEATKRIELLLDTLGLTDAADRSFHSYSSGMKQKLAIARGLLSNPGIVLYDEPTRSLDPLSMQNIRNWIVANRVNSPRTAHLIATNQLQEAEQMCDRVLIINRGVTIASGTVEQIRKKYQKENRVIHRITCSGFPQNGLFRPIPEKGLLEVTEESITEDRTILRVCGLEGSEALSTVLSTILRSGGTVHQCEVDQQPFDEVFCSLILQEQAKQTADSPQGANQ